MSTVDFCSKGVTRQVPFVRFTDVILKRGVFSVIGCRLSVLRSPADEMNDFQGIALGQAGFCPKIASNDAAVQLDGYAVCLHSQLIDKSRERERRIEILRFAVDLQFHVFWIFAVTVGRQQAKPGATPRLCAGGICGLRFFRSSWLAPARQNPGARIRRHRSSFRRRRRCQ